MTLLIRELHRRAMAIVGDPPDEPYHSMPAAEIAEHCGDPEPLERWRVWFSRDIVCPTVDRLGYVTGGVTGGFPCWYAEKGAILRAGEDLGKLLDLIREEDRSNQRKAILASYQENVDEGWISEDSNQTYPEGPHARYAPDWRHGHIT